MRDLLRASPLFSIRRFLAVLVFTVVICLVDMLVIQLLGIETLADLATEVTIHTLGLYLGFTIIALFGSDVSLYTVIVSQVRI